MISLTQEQLLQFRNITDTYYAWKIAVQSEIGELEKKIGNLSSRIMSNNASPLAPENLAKYRRQAEILREGIRLAMPKTPGGEKYCSHCDVISMSKKKSKRDHDIYACQLCDGQLYEPTEVSGFFI